MAKKIQQTDAFLKAKFGQKFQIENHDVQLHTNQPLDNNGFISPLAKGILIHIGILGFIVFTNLPPNLNQQPAVQTSLITEDQLSSIQSQILANRSQATPANNHDSIATNTNQTGGTKVNKSNSVAVDITSDGTVIPNSSQIKNNTSSPTASVTQQKKTVVPSAEAKKRDAKIAEREKQFNEALKAFETKQNKEYQQHKQTVIEQDKKQRAQETELVNVFKEIEKTNEEKVLENLDKLQNEKNKRDLEQAKAESQKNRLTHKNLSNNGIPSTNTDIHQPAYSPTNNGYSGEANSSSGSTRTKTNNISLAIGKIQSNFFPPTASGNNRTSLRVTVDAQGNVRRAVASGTNAELNMAAEQAAKAASPLPVKQGDQDYPTFQINLNGRGNK